MIDFKKKSAKILVIGDIIIDEYFWGESSRISPEAPVQIVDITKKSYNLGGAGNVVRNLHSFGANVDIVSVLGCCKNSERIIELLNSLNIRTDFLLKENNRTSSLKTRLISGHQQVVRFDHESNEEISPIIENEIKNLLKEIIKDYEIIILSDYGKGLLTKSLTQDIIRKSKKNGIKVLVDPKGSDYSKYAGAYLLTPNKSEASLASGISIKDKESLVTVLKKLKNDIQINISLITLSEDGIAIFDKDLKLFPTKAKKVFDVTGAGDTVISAIGFCLANEVNLDETINFANIAAGVVVAKLGSATASLEEINRFEKSKNKAIDKVKSNQEVKNIVSNLKLNGKKIVFTNGCFDIIHAGHTAYLEKAKEHGDFLVVGLNSDQSVKSIKGNDRPINNQFDRASVLAAISAVDLVTIFEEDTPYDLIKLIRPNYLIKGSDYKNKDVAGSDLVEKLVLIEYVENKSTSLLINKIRGYE